jgi:hypothetical protein
LSAAIAAGRAGAVARRVERRAAAKLRERVRGHRVARASVHFVEERAMAMNATRVGGAAGLALAMAAGNAHAQFIYQVLGSPQPEVTNDIIAASNADLVNVGTIGNAPPARDQQVVVLRTTNAGAPLWRSLLGEPTRNDRGFGIQETPGEFVVAYHSSPFGPPDQTDLGLAWLDASGNVTQMYRYPGTSQDFVDIEGGGAIRFVNGEFYVAHRFHPSFDQRFGVFSRIAPGGAPIFHRLYQALTQDPAAGITFADVAYDRESQTFVVAGTISELLGDITVRNILVARLRQNGDLIWANRYGTFDDSVPFDNYGRGVAIRPDGLIVVAAETQDFFFNNDSTELLLDPNGFVLQVEGRRPGTPAFAACEALDDNSVVIAGTYPFGDGSNDAFMWRSDPALALLWHRRYNTGWVTRGEAVTPHLATNSGLVLAGAGNLFFSGFGGDEHLMIRTDLNGDPGCGTDTLGFAVPRFARVEPVELQVIDRFEGLPLPPRFTILDTLQRDLCRPGCPADFNGDAVVDFFDYLDFVAAWSIGDPAGDFNGDSSVDFFDYLDFVAAFDAGC